MATVSGIQRQLTHTSNTYESNGSLTIGGNLNINGSGTVDGRDIAVDGVKLDGIATGANNYSLPAGTSSERGGFKIGYSGDGQNYPVEVSSEQMFVTVPWTDTNTTYSAGNGISLSSTTFSVAAGGGLTQTAAGLSHTDTSLQASVNNSNGTVIQDITLDTYGHITSIGSANLDNRYNNYSLPAGTSSERGGFKIGYSENGQNYPVEVSSEQMFVTVPWTGAIGPIYTAAALPSASPAGQRGFISDSSGELATSHGAVAFGGGSTTIPVYSDGSSWRIG
jgi:hypothetical protein